jgi:hypothetical protein
MAKEIAEIVKRERNLASLNLKNFRNGIVTSREDR